MDYQKASEYWIKKDEASVRMEKADLKKEIDGFVLSHQVCAFACAYRDFVRCTPLEYSYIGGCFYIFSEGGLKFKALEFNKDVCLAIYEDNPSFGNLKGLQVTGKVEIVEPFSEEYEKVATYKKIPIEALKRLPSPMNLLKVVPSEMDYLDSSLKKRGYSPRQVYKA